MKPKTPVLMIAAVVLVLVASSIIIVCLQTPPVTSMDIPSGAGVPVVAIVPATVETGIPATQKTVTPTISEEEATARLQEEYPLSQYSVNGVALNDHYSGKVLYEFTLVPAKDSIYEKNETIFIDVLTGDLYNPLQENAGITIEQAKDLAQQAFPAWNPDRVRMRFHDGSNYVRGWEFYLYIGDEELVHGGLDADTGELSGYAIGVKRMGRPENPSITIDAAQQVADREIKERNGVVPVIISDARLDPLGMPGEKVAGNYVFVYNRVIREVPCDSDGFTLVIDSVAGTVTEYRKTWGLPEDAVAQSAKPAIPKDAAIKTVQQEASKTYPASSASLRIVSADLRWKDYHNPEKSVPAPGSIPLVWKVQFDDETIRTQQWPNPATGWIDAQTGTLLDLYYRH
jgi:hypothetical protein